MLHHRRPVVQSCVLPQATDPREVLLPQRTHEGLLRRRSIGHHPHPFPRSLDGAGGSQHPLGGLHPLGLKRPLRFLRHLLDIPLAHVEPRPDRQTNRPPQRVPHNECRTPSAAHRVPHTDRQRHPDVTVTELVPRRPRRRIVMPPAPATCGPDRLVGVSSITNSTRDSSFNRRLIISSDIRLPTTANPAPPPARSHNIPDHRPAIPPPATTS